jgi:hypothetical protein
MSAPGAACGRGAARALLAENNDFAEMDELTVTKPAYEDVLVVQLNVLRKTRQPSAYMARSSDIP